MLVSIYICPSNNSQAGGFITILYLNIEKIHMTVFKAGLCMNGLPLRGPRTNCLSKWSCMAVGHVNLGVLFLVASYRGPWEPMRIDMRIPSACTLRKYPYKVCYHLAFGLPCKSGSILPFYHTALNLATWPICACIAQNRLTKSEISENEK